MLNLKNDKVKLYVGAIGLAALAIYQLTQGEIVAALSSLSALGGLLHIGGLVTAAAAIKDELPPGIK